MSDREVLSALKELSADVALVRDRQESMIRAMDKMVETIGVLSGQMAELVAWAQEPQSSDLGETMRQLLLVGQNTQGTLVHLGNEIRSIPRRTAEELVRHPA